MNCPKCKKVVGARFREKPKGEKAKFLCFDCLPDEYRQALIDEHNNRCPDEDEDDIDGATTTGAIII